MEKIKEISAKKIDTVSMAFKRYLFDKLDTSRKLIGIKGARGSGKTTLLLQLLKGKEVSEVLYASLDNIYFATHSLFDMASEFNKYGGKYLYLDEVHKYPNWAQEIKNIYDSFDDMHVVFTSSSALEINKGKFDLSRRALIFELQGLSFREFLELKYKIKFPAISLETILETHENASIEIVKTIKPFKFFQEYLESGYYPFFVEEQEFYHQQLRETINLVIETDLPAIYNIDYRSVLKLKALLNILGGIAPYTPNLSKLAAQIGTTRDSLLKYLSLLHNAHIITWLSSSTSGLNFLNKPDKLYLQNPNIAFALSDNTNTGTIRETFLLSQLLVEHKVNYPKISGDFLVNNQLLFEVGGKNKSKKQIQGIKDAYIVADDIEVGYGNRIPLWLFGFMY